ncbi:MAG TPA: c-type cytochrome [Aliidongia sp.]|nr:c-type cytochrome [Aliidongia sp.]
MTRSRRDRVQHLLFGLAISLLPSVAGAAAPPDRAPDTMAARVLACAPCHGAEGQGTKDDYFPRIAGKPADYLYNQLSAFRDGRRKYAPMNYLLEYLPDSYLREIAEYFAAERPPYPTPEASPASKAVLAHGKALVTGGDPAREIPACANCHNPSFTGMQPAIPGLVGLHAHYISAQLGAWRYGTRTAAEPDCMQIVAGHLSEADVTAIAAYLSSLPAPADPSPVPAGSLPMPLACGSEPLK